MNRIILTTATNRDAQDATHFQNFLKAKASGNDFDAHVSLIRADTGSTEAKARMIAWQEGPTGYDSRLKDI